MTRRFSIKEIAFQAGLSPATVDRALHGRDNVRTLTRERVAAALAELESQHAASLTQGRRFTIDIFIQSPDRFSSAVRAAFEAELPLVRPVAFRARFHLAEVMEEREIITRLTAIARRGSHGIVLKVPATPAIEACLAAIKLRGIPVVTYVTDIAAPSILDAFAEAGRKIDIFVAHDLDRTNRQLLAEGKLTLVLHHDFRQDARLVSLRFLRFHRLVPPDAAVNPTDILIACPTDL